MKVTVVDKVDYVIKYEEQQGLTFIHCDIKTKWTKQVKASLQEDFKTLRELKTSPIYALHELNDKKHCKFLQQFGFKYLQDVTGTDSKTRQVYYIG